MSPSSPIMLEKTVGQISKTTEYQPTFIYFKPFSEINYKYSVPNSHYIFKICHSQYCFKANQSLAVNKFYKNILQFARSSVGLRTVPYVHLPDDLAG